MELISIQTGRVRTHRFDNGSTWTTGYVKTPVRGSVHVGTTNITGDEQYNTRVHGGEHRAVLMYSADHYGQWAGELQQELDYGSFGENLTVSGIDEQSACLGDIYQIGDTVRLQVSQPRQPCNNIYKHLGIHGIVDKVDETRRTGWYLRVLQTGTIDAGMPVTLVERPYPDWNIVRAHDVMDNRIRQPEDAAALAAVEALEPNWRKQLQKAAQST